jgi:hypothetical protein
MKVEVNRVGFLLVLIAKSLSVPEITSERFIISLKSKSEYRCISAKDLDLLIWIEENSYYNLLGG